MHVTATQRNCTAPKPWVDVLELTRWPRGGSGPPPCPSPRPATPQTSPDLASSPQTIVERQAAQGKKKIQSGLGLGPEEDEEWVKAGVIGPCCFVHIASSADKSLQHQ